jgi:hypothetical protein
LISLTATNGLHSVDVLKITAPPKIHAKHLSVTTSGRRLEVLRFRRRLQKALHAKRKLFRCYCAHWLQSQWRDAGCSNIIRLAHTDSDIFIQFPEWPISFHVAGDFFGTGHFPFIGYSIQGGSIDGNDI